MNTTWSSPPKSHGTMIPRSAGPSYLIAKNGATTDIRIGDVFDRLAEIPDGTIDLVLTSPPFLALRSYLPADHPDKAKEIGSEANPAEFIDTLLRLSAEWRRVLAPHGSICVELGDTYAGSGQGPDERSYSAGAIIGGRRQPGAGWPLDKSMCGIPHLYHLSLAYGRNLLTGQPSPAGQWRVRNVVAWCLDGDTVVYARTPKGEGPTRLLHLTQNWQPGQWDLWDGERWTPVLGWSASEAADAIEIEFRNGERISATRNHQWPTQRGLLSTDQLTIGDVVRSVTLPEPTRHEPAHLPADDIGWLVGTFLADGSFDSRDRIQIAGHRNESEARLDRLRAIAESFDGTATAHDVGDGNEATVVVRSPILAAAIRRYVGGTGARNKCLRAAAWRRSNRFLDAVLEGYLDGDGHYDAKNERWRLGFTDNGWLARDLRVICARLGYRCRVARLPRSADPRGGKFAGAAGFYWRGEIRRAMNRDLAPTGQIVALRPSKRRRFFDVGVEGEPHLFALGSGILTHNCRPNPPVGALGDKVRPATSYMTMACTSRTRYFDLDAVRTPHKEAPPSDATAISRKRALNKGAPGNHTADAEVGAAGNPAGAPPLDWWEIPTEPYSGAVRGDTLYRASRDCPEHSLPAIQHRLQTAPSGELREALLRNSRRTDASPALKRACVLHANSDLDSTSVRLAMKDWLDQSIQSERTTGSTAESRRPAPGSSEGTPPGYARTLRRTSHTPDERAALDQTMEQLPLGYAETATPHNTASSRTGLAPATSRVGTPSAQTPADIEHTSSGLASSGQHLDIDESSTSEACPLADEHGTSGRTAGRSSRCSCEQFTESTSHYATWPKALLTRPILMMCPEKVCRVCGEPSRRIVGEAEYVNGRTGAPSTALHLRNGKHIAGQGNSVVSDGQGDRNAIRQAPTLGWTDCGCSTDGSHWRRGVVLDPFGGSGTTAVVASRHGRDCIMIDLDPRNLELMRERLDDDALLVERETAQGLPSLFDWSES